MRNAEEHKKLLEQIAELERDSVNYFDVEREFFLIDSENLSAVQTRFYGYSIQESGIYEEDNLTEEAVAGLDGRGCYVYVEVRDGQITIKQDLNGCWGIYLFRHGDYFALSNSFFRLLDHIKFRYPLTVNRDYCNHLLVNDVCSHAYSETAVNEIELADRSTIIHIDAIKKTLETELTNYHEYSVSLNSEEGIATLDRWVELWGKVFRGLVQHTKFITADLSGGFDTRVSFALLLNSGIDLNKIRIFSINDTLICHPEDYEISTQIANRFNFKLNQPLPKQETFNYSLTDILNINTYAIQTFNNIPKFRFQKNVEKTYNLTGNSGETLRAYWRGSPKVFLRNQSWKTKPYSSNLSQELLHSTEEILKTAFHNICNKYGIINEDSYSISQMLYQETRARNHYGKASVVAHLRSIRHLFPALDPIVRTLQLEVPGYSDAKLLIALLFTRYEPDLLKFPFEGGRFITPETIAYAQKLNERFPRRLTSDKITWGGVFNLQPRDTRAEKILASARKNSNISISLPDTCLRATFESSRTYGLFSAYFDEEIYHRAASYYDTHVFGRNRPMYALTGVARVLEDVEISQRNHPPYQDMQRFLEQDFYFIHDDAEIVRKFHLYFTARIQIQLLQKMADGVLKILSVSDNRARITQPEWFQNGGIGYVITSYAGILKIVAKTFVSGRLQVRLLGMDIREREDKSKRVPYWVDYTRLTVNKKTLINALTPAWHDKPYIYTTDVKADEEITIEVEWLPHRSDT